MDARTTESLAGDRVVKRAGDVAQRGRIVAEAGVLAAGQIPGVVELVAVEDDGERPSLVTRRVAGPDLGRANDLSIEEVAGVVAAIATVLADLHDLGLVHGAVMASHVLVGDDGRPVLCGFGYGGRAGDPPIAEAPLPEGFSDPARRPGDPLAPAGDVYALGALLRAMTVVVPATTSRARHLPRSVGARGQRARRSSRPSRAVRPADRSARAALLAVAGRATTADPALRLGARSLAAAVGMAVPGASLPRQPHPDPAPELTPPAPALDSLRRRSSVEPTGRSRHRRTRLVLVAGCVVVAVLVAGRLVSATEPGGSLSATEPSGSPRATSPTVVSSSAPPSSDMADTAVATTVGRATPSSVSPPTAVIDPACPTPTAALAADVDADGCAEDLRWSDGVLEAGGRHWRVGQPGDRVATADWSCSGRPALALLRPATGEVFVFDGWAEAGRDLVAEVAGRVEGGFAIRAADVGDGCPRVAVERGDAGPVTLPARRRP